MYPSFSNSVRLRRLEKDAEQICWSMSRYQTGGRQFEGLSGSFSGYPRLLLSKRCLTRLNQEPFDFIERELVVTPVVEACGAGALVVRRLLGDFKLPTIL